MKKDYSNLKPLGTRILVHQPEPDTVSSGGIHLPERFLERPPEAMVRALGTGDKMDPEWEFFEVSEGETVLLEKFGGTDLGDGWKIVDEKSVLGVLQIEEDGRKLYPVGGNVLVAILPPEEKVGSLFIPEKAQEVQEFGVVKAASERCDHLKEGDYVFVSRLQGTLFGSGGVDHVILHESKVKAIVRKGDE